MYHNPQIATVHIYSHECGLGHSKSVYGDQSLHPSLPDYCCTSYHTTHKIHSQTLLTPGEERDIDTCTCMLQTLSIATPYMIKDPITLYVYTVQYQVT